MTNQMTDDERSARDIEMLRTYDINGGEFEAVSFKDEGTPRRRIGPVYVYAKGVDPLRAGSEGEGVFYLGWSTFKSAKDLAARFQTKLVQW